MAIQISATTLVDDISRMNEKEVSKVFCVLTTEDIKQVIHSAHAQKIGVSIRGQNSSMGGQTIAENGIVIDTQFMNRIININIQDNTVTFESGVLWGELITAVNKYGLSPAIVQSYSNFSTGGSIAVNIHGVVGEQSLGESIVSMSIINAIGEEIFLLPTDELFGFVLGGFGLFGVIVSATIRLVPNCCITDKVQIINANDFVELYHTILPNPNIIIKIAHVDIHNVNNINIYTYTQTTTADINPVSNLLLDTISYSEALLYKWIVPIRPIYYMLYKYQQISRRQLEISSLTTRNNFLYGGIVPLKILKNVSPDKLYTYILHEFFIPDNVEVWNNWYLCLRDVVKFIIPTFTKIKLLNITIQYVKKHSISKLSYAPTNMYACMFYYVIEKSIQGDNQLKRIHTIFSKKMEELNGSFYLPYRCCYSAKTLKSIYPTINTFFITKLQHDPHEIFTNMWYQTYKNITHNTEQITLTEIKKRVPIVCLPHRNNSFTQLFTNNMLKHNLQTYIDNHLQIIPHLYDIIFQLYTENTDKCDTFIYSLLKKKCDSLWYPSINYINIVQHQQQIVTNHMVEIIHLIEPLRKSTIFNGILSIGNTFCKKTLYTYIDIKGPSYTIKNPSIHLKKNSIDIIVMLDGFHRYSQDIPSIIRMLYALLRPGGILVFQEHNITEEIYPFVDIIHSIHNIYNNVSVYAEASETRGYRSITDWRLLIEQEGFTDSHIYRVQENDLTRNTLCVFIKQSTEQCEHEIENVYTHSPTIISEIHSDFKQLFGCDMLRKCKTTTHYSCTDGLLTYIYYLFVLSLDTEPWYMFPFVTNITKYWKACGQQLYKCVQINGIKGFTTMSTTIFNGILFSIFFIFMTLLSLFPKIHLQIHDKLPIHSIISSTTNIDIQSIVYQLIPWYSKENQSYSVITCDPDYFNNIVKELVELGIQFVEIVGCSQICVSVVINTPEQYDRIIQLEPSVRILCSLTTQTHTLLNILCNVDYIHIFITTISNFGITFTIQPKFHI